MVDKIANPAAAANAYSKTAKVGMNISGEDEGKTSFGDMMRNVGVSMLNTMRNSDVMSARAVSGEASLPEVVSAVNAADLTLQTVVAVRDRLINAYQEIMRMPM
jgi:flagellar hook-basal body complex protein FliE